MNENDVVNVKLGDKALVTIDAYGERKFHGTVVQIANTGKTTGTGTQEEVTNFEVKTRIDDNDVKLRPGLSCTAEIQTNMVKDVVAVPMQSVTIRTGDSNMSPEEIEKRKQKQEASDKGDNAAEFKNQKLEKKTEKEEREKIHLGLAQLEECAESGVWLAGPDLTAADIVAYPGLKLLLRASRRPEAAPLALGFDDFETRFPGITAWMQRVEQLPGYEKTYLPHWRQVSP